MWLWLALASCLFWAALFVLDSHLVDEVFDRWWVGVVVNAVIFAAVLPFLATGVVLAGWVPLSPGTVLLGLLAGVAFGACQTAHFRALRDCESGIVAAYWSLTPLFVLVGGRVFLGESFAARVYLGITVLVVASAAFCRLDANRAARWRSLGVMTAGCVAQAVYFVAQKPVFDACPVWQGAVLILAGVTAAGLAPLCARGPRRVFRDNFPKLRRAIRLIVLIEVFHLIALLLGQFAVAAGTPSRVAAAEATIPAFTFLMSVGLFAAFGRYGEAEARRHLGAKLVLVAILGAGVFLIS